MAGKVIVQYWCFRSILAPIAQVGDTHYPGTRSTGSSITGISNKHATTGFSRLWGNIPCWKSSLVSQSADKEDFSGQRTQLA